MIGAAEINPDAKLSMYQARKSANLGRSPVTLLEARNVNSKLNGTQRQTVKMNKVNFNQ